MTGKAESWEQRTRGSLKALDGGSSHKAIQTGKTLETIHVRGVDMLLFLKLKLSCCLQAWTLEHVAISFFRVSSRPREESGSPALQADSLPTEL